MNGIGTVPQTDVVAVCPLLVVEGVIVEWGAGKQLSILNSAEAVCWTGPSFVLCGSFFVSFV